MTKRVLVIDIDSLRPDHIGAFGYQHDTTPTLDVLASDGISAGLDTTTGSVLVKARPF